jgi:hypothetical protein
MAKARKHIELAVRVGNKPGILGDLFSTISSAGINILAYCSYSDRDEGVVLLVTEDPIRAKDVIEVAGYNCRANSVVIVGAQDQVGAAAQLGAHLGRAGINILYSYASSSGSGQFCAVFKTMDDERAIEALDEHWLAQAA